MGRNPEAPHVFTRRCFLSASLGVATGTVIDLYGTVAPKLLSATNSSEIKESLKDQADRDTAIGMVACAITYAVLSIEAYEQEHSQST